MMNRTKGKARRTTPERRPSPVRAWICPQMRKRSRIRLADLVEDFGQVAAGLPLQDDGGDEEAEIEVGDASPEVLQAFLHGDAKVLLFEDAVEFAADRRRHFAAHHVEAEGQALPGAERAESISMASGNWAPKTFSRLWRRNQTQTRGSAPSKSPATGISGDGCPRT